MRIRVGFIVVLMWLGLSPAFADKAKLDVHPVHGPTLVKLGDNLATIDLPKDMLYLNVKDTKQFLKVTGNEPSGRELGVVLPPDNHWFVIIEYSDTGYVADDEAGKLDADAILKSIREGTEEANKERKAAGASEVHVEGWEQVPIYEHTSHHVVWGVKGSGSDGEVVNYNTRILGRRGVLALNLVCDPKDLDINKKDLGTLLDKTSYLAGQRYEDYQASTDKKAEYGLTGLILGGGAAAAALKLGLFGKLGNFLIAGILALKKFLILLVAGVAAKFKTWFGKKTPKPNEPAETVVKG